MLRRKIYCIYFNYFTLALHIIHIIFLLIITDKYFALDMNYLYILAKIIIPFYLIQSQAPTILKLSALGPGWGFGSLGTATSQTQETSQPKFYVWCFNIILVLSIIFYIFLYCYFFMTIKYGQTEVHLPALIGCISSLIGYYGIITMHQKRVSFILFIYISIIFIINKSFKIIFDIKIVALYSYILILFSIIILSQFFYLLKQRQIKLNVLRQEHFKNGASFSSADFADFLKARSSLLWFLPSFYAPGLLLSLALAEFASKSVGGFVGNISALIIIFGFLFAGLFLVLRRKKRYDLSTRKLGVNKLDVQEACRLLKRGAGFDGNGGLFHISGLAE
jgi:hypothetical protein